MVERSFRLSEGDNDDYRQYISGQQNEFQHIKTQATRIIQTVLAVFALVGSFISLQVIFSINLPSPTATIPLEWFNRCLSGDLAAQSDPILHLGEFNSRLAVILLLLSLWLLVEAILGATWTLKVPPLRPFREENVSFGNYRDWIEHNHQLISKADRLLFTSSLKLQHAVIIAITSTIMLTLSYLGQGATLAVIDTVVPPLVLVYLIWKLPAYLKAGKVWTSRLDRDLTRILDSLLTMRVTPIVRVVLLLSFIRSLGLSLEIITLFQEICL